MQSSQPERSTLARSFLATFGGDHVTAQMSDAEIRRLRDRVAELERLLAKYQWAGLTPVGSAGACPECAGSKPPGGAGHRPGCAIAAALAAASDTGSEV
jgi:hypothetical protein